MESGKGNRITVRELCVTAALIAIAVALHRIELFRMPQGGAVTAFAMVFVALPGWLFGVVTGGLGGAVFGIVELLLDGYFFHPGSFIFDYVLAFGAMGAVAGLFRGLPRGYICAAAARFASSFISGLLFFAASAPGTWFDGRVPGAFLPVAYSFWYNLSYIVPEAVATVIVISLPPVRKALDRVYAQYGRQRR